MASDQRDSPGDDPKAALVEHSSTGGRFTRLLGSTFSLEDGFTLKHVAAVIAVLFVVVLIFGLISYIA